MNGLVALEALVEERDPAFARALLAAWTPPDAEQARERDRIVAWIDRFPCDAHRRERLEGHLTASALVVDAERGVLLLTHHRKLGRWLQLGGHCDGDANLARAALREALEESGIEGLAVDPVPLDVDVHAIPARPGEPEHLHLDTRFLVLAPAGAKHIASPESIALSWFSPHALPDPADASVERLVRRVFGRDGRLRTPTPGTARARPV